MADEMRVDAVVGEGEIADPLVEAYEKGFDEGVAWAKDNYETILWVMKQQLSREDNYSVEKMKRERDELDARIRQRTGAKLPPHQDPDNPQSTPYRMFRYGNRET